MEQLRTVIFLSMIARFDEGTKHASSIYYCIGKSKQTVTSPSIVNHMNHDRYMYTKFLLTKRSRQQHLYVLVPEISDYPKPVVSLDVGFDLGHHPGLRLWTHNLLGLHPGTTTESGCQQKTKEKAAGEDDSTSEVPR